MICNKKKNYFLHWNEHNNIKYLYFNYKIGLQSVCDQTLNTNTIVVWNVTVQVQAFTKRIK